MQQNETKQTMQNAPETVSIDAETEAELRRLKSRAAVATGVALAGFGSVFLLGILFQGTNLIPIGFVIMILGGIIAGRMSKQYSNYYKEHVVVNMTLTQCDFLDNLTFNPNDGISREEADALRVISHDTFRSNDLITATYHGVSFRQSDVYMGEIVHDKNGSHENTVFRGRWMVFDFNKDFHWDLQVMSRNFMSAHRMGGLFGNGGRRMERVKLENEVFNKAFRVFAQDEHEAFYLLTPSIMDALWELRKQLNSPIMLVFREGILHVVVYNNEDAFEGKLFGKMDLAEERDKILHDIRLVTDFVDALAIERDIFKYEK